MDTILRETPRNSHRWEAAIITQELRLLKRECSHLQAKSQERVLSSWESNRLKEICEEILILASQLGKIPERRALEMH